MRAAPVSLMLLMAGCDGGPPPGSPAQSPRTAIVVPSMQAVRTAYVPSLDPHTMVEAEVARVLSSGPRCAFHYTDGGKPVVAFTPGTVGVLKLNGSLVRLSAEGVMAEGGGVLSAEGLRVAVVPEPRGDDASLREQRPADMRFAVQGGAEIGYRGFFDCG